MQEGKRKKEGKVVREACAGASWLGEGHTAPSNGMSGALEVRGDGEIFHLAVCHCRPPRITLTHISGAPRTCWRRTG